MHWMVTRPRTDGDRVASCLQAIGHTTLSCPLTTVVFADEPAPDLTGIQAVLATSRHGVAGLARLCDQRDRPMYVVGNATAEAARNEGFSTVESADGNADALVSLVRRRLDPSDGALLRIRGAVARGDVAQSLTEAGFDVRSMTTYRIDTVGSLPDIAKTALIEPSIDGVLFFSPRSAKLFARLVGEAALSDCLSGLAALCLSPAIAECLDRNRWRTVRAAGSPDLAALIALAREFERPSNEIWPRAKEPR